MPIIEEVKASWSLAQELVADRNFHEQGSFGDVVAAEHDRLVIGTSDAELTAGGTFGVLETFTRDVSGAWVRENVTPRFFADDAWHYEKDLQGDRMAIGGAIYGYGGAAFGWTLSRRLDLSAASGWWRDEGPIASVALDEDRAVLGGHYDAPAFVFDLNAAQGADPVQLIEAGDFSTRDFNPPYSAFCRAEGGHLAIRVGTHWDGAHSVRIMEWFDGEYRLVEAVRVSGTTHGSIDVEDERFVLLSSPSAGWAGNLNLPARFELRRLDSARVVPHCGADASLMAFGSGAAPFAAARVRGCGLTAGSPVVLFAGPTSGLLPLGSAQLCIDPSQGLFRVSAPITASAAGDFALPTSTFSLAGLGAALAPGGSFTLQDLFRDGAGDRATNTLRIYLCE